jgi:SAM-dependent methyltransferase
MMQEDKAGKAYWDSMWSDDDLPPPIQVDVPDKTNYKERRFHRELERLFAAEAARGQPVRSVIEVGCARSRWLPHLRKHFGVEVTGLDYSEAGCAKARRLLEREGQAGEVVCADFFAPPERLVGKFDALVSFGVAEHFVDTAACIRTFARFLRPGGFMLTSVPNLVGINGALQKLASRAIYDKHVPLSREDLRAAHQAAGLVVEECDYFVAVNTGIVALAADDPRPVYAAKRVLLAGAGVVSRLVWRFEATAFPLPPTALFSGFVTCVARKDS